MTITILSIITALSFSCAGNADGLPKELLKTEKQEVAIASSNVLGAETAEVDVELKEDEIPAVQENTLKEINASEMQEEVTKQEVENSIEKNVAVREQVKKIQQTEAVDDEEVLIGDLNAEDHFQSLADAETSAKKETSIVEEVSPVVVIAKPDHSSFNSLLSSHVSSKGVVNYNGFKGDISKLDAYLKDLENNPITSDWSRNEKLAYWINAYNAYTIKLILDNYPVNSIQDIAGGKPWDKKWINIDGKTYSLNNIENDIIRPQFNEPRIHFAVNCAAQSCPPLANKAFTAQNMNSLLDKQTKAFVNNQKFNTIGKDAVQVSKIFDWYGKDFGNLITFLQKYASSDISDGAKITYTEYDWGLNNK